MELIREIWASYRRLPLWVQAWVGLWLAPVNFAAVAFVGERNGVLIAVLMLAGILPNLPIMVAKRGMTALMALPHLLAWPLMLIIVVVTLFQGTSSAHSVYLVLVLITNVISLAFDAVDFNAWRNGHRSIA